MSTQQLERVIARFVRRDAEDLVGHPPDRLIVGVAIDDEAIIRRGYVYAVRVSPLDEAQPYLREVGRGVMTKRGWRRSVGHMLDAGLMRQMLGVVP